MRDASGIAEVRHDAARVQSKMHLMLEDTSRVFLSLR